MRVVLRIMHRPRPAGIGFHDLPLAFMWASLSQGDIEPKFDVTLFCISDFFAFISILQPAWGGTTGVGT